MAHDVFISHSSKNKRDADAVCATLERCNLRCWIAPRDILPGEGYGKALVDAIGASRVFVLIVTSDANKSDDVRRELEAAAKKGIVIIPFRTEDIALSGSFEYFLGSLHWMDATSPPLERRIEELAEKILLQLPD